MNNASRNRARLAGRSLVLATGLLATVSGCVGSSTPDTQSAAAQPGSSPKVGISAPTKPPAASPLANYKFPDESTWTVDDLNQVTVSKKPLEPWAVYPCRSTSYPPDPQRIASRTATATGPEYFVTDQISVFTTEEAAAKGMTEFRRILAACSKKGADGWLSAPVSAGDEAVLAWHLSIENGQPVYPSSQFIVIRDGRTIYLRVTASEFIAKGPEHPDTKPFIADARKLLPLPQ